MTRSPGSRDAQWPAEKFFFARLDTSRLPKSLRSREKALRYLFESELPLPVDEVHAVFVPIFSATVLAVGALRSDLRAETGAGGSLEDRVALRPASLPDWLDVDQSVLSSVNLLVGEFAPAAVTKAKRTRGAIALLASTLIAAMFVLGVERRLQHVDSALDALDAREETALRKVLGSFAASDRVPTVQRIAAVLGEKRKLERTRSGDLSAKTEVLDDVAPGLARILVAWPAQKDVEVDIRTLMIGPSGIVIRGEGKDAATCQNLCDTLSKLDTIRVDQPQVSAGADTTKVEFEVRAKRQAPKSKVGFAPGTQESEKAGGGR